MTSPTERPLPTIKQESRLYFEALGRRIAQLRKSRGYTQLELARRLGVSPQSVFAYELGDRRVSILILERMAKLFQMPLDQLVGFGPDQTASKRRLSWRAIRHAERLQSLSKTEQHFVIRIIDQLEGRGRARKG